ncbi:MAG: alpha/beta fold hydrolase [Synechococcus sp.]
MKADRETSYARPNSLRGISVADLEQRRIVINDYQWFYCQVPPSGAEERSPVILLHDILAQSYSWRQLLPALADQGHRAIAPDWPGGGLSDKPDPREFDYSPAGLENSLAAFIDALELDTVSLVVQGYLGVIGLQYAIHNSDRIDRIAIVNTPFYPGAKLSFKLQQLGFPLAGEMLTQDPLCVDRTLEGGGGNVVPDADLEIYRAPFLKSSAAGRALLSTVRKYKLASLLPDLESGLPKLDKPMLVAWGENDSWLSCSKAKDAANALKKTEFTAIANAGHYAQIDNSDRLIEVIPPFFRRQVF